MKNKKCNIFIRFSLFAIILCTSQIQANIILEDKIIFKKNDIVKIENCNKKLWCKLQDNDYYIKKFRITKSKLNTYTIAAPDNTYTYKKYNKNNISYDMQIYISKNINEEQIKKDLKFGYLRHTVIYDYYIAKQKVKENIAKAKLEEKRKKVLQLEKNKVQINKQISKQKVIVKKEPLFTYDKLIQKNKNISKNKNKNKFFKSIGLLIENYNIDKVDTTTNINYPDDVYCPGIEYKIGIQNASYRYYGILRAASGLELLVSVDYIINSKIFFGASIGYGRIKINDTSSNISGALYGGQIGYMINNKLELSYQMLKSNMDEKVSNINYEIDTFNYLLLNYKF